jgi:putative ABC transport system permease protein
MRAGPVRQVLGGSLARRRMQTIVITMAVLVSTGTAVLGLALAIDSTAPFSRAFAAQHGAEVTAAVNPSRATPAALAATRRLPEVTAAAGPYAEATVTLTAGGAPGCHPAPATPCYGRQTLPPMTLAGRSSPGGPVDNLSLQSGHWAQQPGQIVLSSAEAGPDGSLPPFVTLGTQLTASGLPGTPRLTVVGTATSITGSADGWVAPAEIAALRAQGSQGAGSQPAGAQMLYRFRSAGSATAISADVAALSAALPAGAVTGFQSYLTVKAQEGSGIAPIAPFMIAFGLTGLLVSVLIVINVVTGAVAAGYQRIGVLKSIGFTPGQVTAAYTAQAALPAAAGCLAGLVAGNLAAVPLLGRSASVYRVATLGVPAWADAAVAAAMCGLAAAAALVPAARAGRMSAVTAIAAVRAPGAGRGLAAQRLLGALPLPRPVAMGLAAPFARPARAAVTLVVVLAGAASVTLAAGLSGTLGQVVNGLTHSATEQVLVTYNGGVTVHGGPGGDPGAAGALPGPGGSGQAGPGPSPASQLMGAAQQRTVTAALRALPGALHYTAEADVQASMAGLAGELSVTAFRGSSGWTGYGLISGHWYTGAVQADVPAGFLASTGTSVGDTVTITFSGRQIPVRIVGEVFDTDNGGLEMFTSWQTLARAAPGLAPGQYDIGLRPGTPAAGYAQKLDAALGPAYSASVNSRDRGLPVVIGLVALLTLLLAIVAGLGVLQTVVLTTRERVHDLGVLKAIGMTPRQVSAMAVGWVAGTGLAAGVIAVPAGIIAQRYLTGAILAAAGSPLPPGYLNVYHPGELAGLALAGVVIASLAALPPASWAAAGTTASALRAG